MENVCIVGIGFDENTLMSHGIFPHWDFQKSLHITLAYKPDEDAVKTFEFGKVVEVEVNGEGFFGNQNQGLFVKILDEDVKCCNAVQHLTVSINSKVGAKAVNTKFMTLTKPHHFTIHGRIMWMDFNYQHHYTSPV